LHGMQGVSGSNPLRSTILIFRELEFGSTPKIGEWVVF